MASIIPFVCRNWALAYPEKPAKSQDALRIGLLGASTIAPLAVIGPAKSHPDVIIAAVAARDEKRAATYAKQHGIPIVHVSYQELIDDPSIDAVYIPLPNGLHYEWALKALKARKHVLLEKPSTNNASEASSLFRSPLLSQPNAPILLEAFHARFHPACSAFLSHIDHQNVVSAHATLTCPRYVFPETDIRFDYDIGGGVTMDMGAYTTLFLRLIFGTEPDECLEAVPRLVPKGFDQRCDQAMTAKWQFPNGGIGTMYIDLSLHGLGPIPGFRWPRCEVEHRETVVQDESLGEGGKEHVMVKRVVIWNMVMPVVWHRIDIIEHHIIRSSSDKKPLKTWSTTEYQKAYTWQDEARTGQGRESWSTYRHQLEQFVHRIKGRGSSSGIWMDGEDSVKQMEMIDSAYKKAGLPLRPTSSYQETV
ncbi:hypothetical protein IFR04_009585 [Cadophora malorum]|uniref:D-xylose 1-dehydrogenase (NADP(+), D-xylono-1,5-lactone-forming) n=1 Tax=Cadophora malorum TaxID=108018 RepID=A0A8H7W4W3_9HELO|nr:hypothetical protein IFR04_009585 [Cadophora malorum]